MDRRSFVGLAASAALTGQPVAAARIPIIDCHIQLFQPTRPQAALADRYRKIAAPLGVVGAIEVEASPKLENNQWALDVAAKDPIIVGTVGNLEPGKPDFARDLDRFHKNPLFLGIRYGNLWGRNLGAEIERPEFISGMKLLSKAGLTLDTADPTPALIEDIVRLTDRVPSLRVVIDHLPQMQAPRRDYQVHLRELGNRPQIYVKISQVFRRIDGQVPTNLFVYLTKLEEIFGVFGEDRVLFGSDWPNSDSWRPYADVLRLVQAFFDTKGSGVAEKYFWKNSVKARSFATEIDRL